jgi:hypothetical protein
MVDQGINQICLGFVETVKGLPGQACISAKLTDGYILKKSVFHHFQKGRFKLALLRRGFVCYTLVIHAGTSCLAKYRVQRKIIKVNLSNVKKSTGIFFINGTEWSFLHLAPGQPPTYNIGVNYLLCSLGMSARLYEPQPGIKPLFPIQDGMATSFLGHSPLHGRTAKAVRFAHSKQREVSLCLFAEICSIIA